MTYTVGRLADLLADPRHTRLEQAWLKVTLTDPVRPAQAMLRLRDTVATIDASAISLAGATEQMSGAWNA